MHRLQPNEDLVPIADAKGFGLLELESRSGLRAEFLPSGALFALRHRHTLINQVLPGPAEEGLFRLLVRWRTDGNAGRGKHAAEGAAGWAALVGPGLGFSRAGPRAVTWVTETAGALGATTTFALHATLAAWTWRIRVRNASPSGLHVDVFHAQDLGLADEAAVRNNEAYVSHYLDLLPVADAALGWVILARQNQPMAGGRHPWLAVGCATGAAAFCMDGRQFFGADHRVSGEPAAVRQPSLPSQRLQDEFALAGLQSRMVQLAPGGSAEIVFVARYVDDHLAASAPDDAAALGDIVSPRRGRISRRPPASPRERSIFIRSSWLHGATSTAADWDAWFPGARRHEERADDGALLAFFHGADTHVVARGKESTVQRPHGHILRSGEPRWIDRDHFGITCYAAGIFGAQAYLGNPNLARLLSVVRNHLNVARGSGQRVFIRAANEWRQLGVPSAFAMTPGDARWIYRLDDGIVEARAWCSPQRAAAFLELRVTAGASREFLVTHQLALGAHEFDAGGGLQIHDDATWIACVPDPQGFTARHLPGLCFAIATAEPADVARLGADEWLYPDGLRRGGPYAVGQTRSVDRCRIILLGSLDGTAALSGAVAAARQELAAGGNAARALDAPVRLAGAGDPAVARMDEILPWFSHDAGIHFSAPHGLEQYGDAAWGVRDVCQGSLEWLLAAGEWATARRMLATVFAQQYQIGLQYLHAHLRYAEAIAKIGDGDTLWWALQVANPVGLAAVVPHAAPRQSNVYFSSSDADFADRLEASARWKDLRTGRVAVRGGWRLYSSGPGLFLHKVRACLLGVRESFGDVVFDPVLPRGLDGLVARLTVNGRPVELRYRVRTATFGPSRIVVNGAPLSLGARDHNPYRVGGARVPAATLSKLLGGEANTIEVGL